jgi:transposase InsO family protein
MELTESYPVKVVCEALVFPRSSFYYRPVRQADEALRAALLEEAGTFPVYGYRRLTEELRRKGWRVNSKRIRRLMREMNLQIKPKAQKKRTTDSKHDLGRYPNLIRDLEITRPNQVWAAEITYIRLQREFVYQAVIMDVFTRAVRGWHLARRLDHQLTLTALEKALAYGKPEIHHSDQGIQYATLVYVKRLQTAEVQISMADVGRPTQNPHVERLIRTIKEEEVDLSEYDDARDAFRQIGNFIDDVYTYKRIHSCLGYLTPIEFELQWYSAQTDEEVAVI